MQLIIHGSFLQEDTSIVIYVYLYAESLYEYVYLEYFSPNRRSSDCNSCMWSEWGWMETFSEKCKEYSYDPNYT